MNRTFAQESQSTENQINVVGDYYHYGDIHPRHGASPNRPAVLHNLPQRYYTQFIGRTAELQKIVQLLRPYPQSQHAFVTIDGMGGMGKSTLALEVAHLLLEQYESLSPSERFDAIIWTSAKERTLTGDGIKPRHQTLRTLHDLYRTISLALQREDIAKAVMEEQPTLLHTVLIQQRTLIIVDNLETIDDDAVINFIRELPAPTKVVITTRHRIDVAYAVRLEGMHWEDTENLIAQECHNRNIQLSSNESQQLFKLTGGAPLAIVWSIAQIGLGYPSDSVIQRLGTPNNDVIRFCFDGSIELIKGKPAHTMLLALSLFRDGTTRDAIGKVSDILSYVRDDGLVLLEKLSLVNRISGRFKLASPMVEIYAQSLLSDDEMLESELRERWINYLLEFVIQRHQAKHVTIDEVTPELRNLLDVIDWCQNNGRYETVLQFLSKVDFYLWTSGSWDIRQDYLHLGIDAGTALGNELVQANFMRRLAETCDMQGNWEQSTKLAGAALAYFERCGDQYGALLAAFILSATYYKLRKFQLAKEMAHKALGIAEKQQDTKALMRIVGRLGTISIEEGNFQSAKQYLDQAVQLEQSLDDYQRKSWSSSWLYRLIGRMHLGENDYEEARANLEYSLNLAQSINNPQEISETTSRLAELHFQLGNKDKANEMAVAALNMFRMLGMKRHIERAEKLLQEISATTGSEREQLALYR